MEILIIIVLVALGIFGSKSSSNSYNSYRKYKTYKQNNKWTFNFETSDEINREWNDLRKQVFKRDSFKCTKCGFKKNLTVDHITPKNAGGTDVLSNLRTLCALCHEEVHNRKIFDENEVFTNNRKTYNPSSKVLVINSAISSNDTLNIVYTDEKGRITKREIRPIKIFEVHGILYVRSYCELRNDERTFRLSRMTIS